MNWRNVFHRKHQPNRWMPLAASSAAILSAMLPVAQVGAQSTTAQSTTAQSLVMASYSSELTTNLKSIALPLVSVGQGVGWKLDPEDYRLYVPQAAAGRNGSLEVYSPETNRNDYAAIQAQAQRFGFKKSIRANYYGDELYGKKASLKSTFTLSNPAKQVLVKRSFGLSKTHSNVPLYRGALEAGYYNLNVASFGLGKNAFQLRASAGVRVEASQFVVNARGQFNKDQLIGFIDLGQKVVGKTVKLENYDADGAKELVLTLVDPNGKRRALKVSEDTKWASDEIKVTRQNVGSWKILARILPTTVQFSNSVGFRFRIDGESLFARLPGFETTPVSTPAQANGTLEVGASAVSCSTRQGIDANFTLIGETGRQSFKAPANLSLKPGNYTLEPESKAGAISKPVSVTISDGKTSSGKLEYQVQNTLKLEPGKLALEPGQNASVQATVTTEFTQSLPVNLSSKSSENLEPNTVTSFTGSVSSSTPFVVSIPVRALNSGTASLSASLGANCPSETVEINVASPAKLALEKSVDKPASGFTLKPGDAATFTISVTNTGGSTARKARLSDTLPKGLTGANLNESFDLEPGAKKSFTLPVKIAEDAVVAGASILIENTATLDWNSSTLKASASVKAALPAVVVAPVIAPAKLTLEKTVDKPANAFTLKPGDPAIFSITVTNTGGSAAKGIQLSDTLPKGISGTNLNERFNLEPGAKKSFEIPTQVAADAVGAGSIIMIENTAELTWNGEKQKASASIKAALPAVPEPAKLTLEKSVDKPADTFTLKPGDAAVFTVTVTNTGDSTAKGIELSDPLAFELVGNELNETFDLEAGAKKVFTIPTRIADGAVEAGSSLTIDNTAFLYWQDDELTASASVKAALPALAVVPEPAPVVAPPVEPTPVEPTVVVPALPEQRRESQLIVLAKLSEPVSNGMVVLSNRLPIGSTYIAGSSRQVLKPSFDVNQATSNGSQPISDPYVSGDRLFWLVSADTQDTYAITYRVAHTDAISVPETPAVLLIRPGIRNASNSGGTSNPEAIKFDVNSALGKIVAQGDVQLLQGETGVLEALRTAVPFGSSEAASTAPSVALGGTATSLRVEVRRATSDPADKPELVIAAFDANGLPANNQLVTLEITSSQGRSVEAAVPDAAPEIPGYQIRLENGIARLPLAIATTTAASSGIQIQARIETSDGIVSSSNTFETSDFKAKLDPTTAALNATTRPLVAVGTVGIQANFGFATGSSFTVAGGIRAFARGTVLGDWFLTAAINQQAVYDPSKAIALTGELLPPANPYERLPLLGDASTLGSDARSSDGFYLKLERGPSYLLYGQMTPGFQGLLSNYSPNFNGLQGVYRNDGFKLSSFVSLVPNAVQRNTQRADGTGFYRLPNAPIAANSEKVTIITFDKGNPDLKLTQRVLVRNTDYTLDYTAGIIQLARPLNSSDANGNPQVIETAFSSEADAAPRELRYGAQASLGSDVNGFQITGTALSFKPGTDANTTAGTPAINPNMLFGLAANFRAAGFQAGLEGAYSGPLGTGGLGLAGQLNINGSSFQAQARYQELFLGYIDPNTASASSGRAINAALVWKLSNAFGLNANFTHNQNFTSGNADDSASAQLRGDFGFASLSLGAYSKLEFANAALLPWSPTRGIWATAGLEVPVGPLRFGVLQRVPITGGTYGDTTLSLDYAISPSFGIRLSDVLTYQPNNIRQQLGLGARGSFSNAELIRTLTGNSSQTSEPFGSTNIAAGYEFDSLAGDAGRTRIGLDTTIPLGSNWSAQLGGEALFNSSSSLNTSSNSNLSANLGLLYSSDTLRGSSRAQLNWQPNGIKQVYTIGAIAKIGDSFVISPNLEYANLPTVETRADGTSIRDGGKFSIAAAWRANQLSILTNHTGRFGIYAPKGDELEGELQLGFEANERLFLRAGAQYKSASVFTGQVTLGGTYYLTDQFGLGANGSYLFQPATNTGKFGFGLEASLRVLTDFTLSAGFNLLGFNDGLNTSSAPGFYLRLDWKFDERLFGMGR